KKESGPASISLERTTDILAWLGEHKEPHQTLIGFAMETEELTRRAKEKREKKNVDWILAKTRTFESSGCGADNNNITAVGNAGQREYSGLKQKIACLIVEAIFS